jgi:hypothetical protein
MNSSFEDFCNDSYMSDWYNEHQVDRDWARRLNRDRDSKSNCYRDHQYKDDDHYPEDSSYFDEDISKKKGEV